MIAYDQLDSHFLDTQGLRLHARLGGKGAVKMVFLHGFPEFSYSWRHQVHAFADQAQLLLPDLRGYHLSAKPKGVKAYQLSKIVADIQAWLDYLDWQEVCLIGHDWGGAAAWTLAAQHPARIQRLIILNMPHPDELRRQLWRNGRQLLRFYYAWLFQIPYLPEWFFSRHPRWLFKRALHKRSRHPEAFSSADLDRYVAAFSEKGSWRATLNYYRAFFRYPTRNKLPLLQMPVQLIWGENDLALGKELTYRTAQYCQQPPEIHYLRDCSHWVQHEYPQQVNALIKAFCQIPAGDNKGF